ncbi:MAG: ribonuclease D [Gammaproteobacteria bacterium]|nr:ribonuclease D [Gammaproteobacteria bacterium]
MPKHQWIDSNARLANAAERWHGVIGLDTEFQRTDTFHPIAGLYQLVADAEIWLIDPLAIDDWRPLTQALEDPATVKIMHSCSEDLELIAHHLGARPANLFDTQMAYAFVSEHLSISYANLVKALLGLLLPKQQVRSNWLRRPLSDAQVSYACADVASLPALHQLLSDELQAKGRWHWFREDMALREAARGIEPERYYLGVKGAWRLNGTQLGALKALCAWRERRAMSEDKPRNRVVWDEHLLKFARHADLAPALVEEHLPRRLAQRYGDALVAAHRKGRAAPVAATVPRPLSGSQNALVKQLRAVGGERAASLGLAPELLSRRRDLEACLRHHASTGELPATYRGWRGALVGSDFTALLDAQAS